MAVIPLFFILHGIDYVELWEKIKK